MARLAPFGGHPSPDRLLAWLDSRTEVNDPDVGSHLSTCERCADRVEQLARDNDSAESDADGVDGRDGELNAAIREIFATPPDLAERLKRAVSERERADREMSLFGDLFRLPGHLVDALFGPAVSDSNVSRNARPDRSTSEDDE